MKNKMEKWAYIASCKNQEAFATHLNHLWKQHLSRHKNATEGFHQNIKALGGFKNDLHMSKRQEYIITY